MSAYTAAKSALAALTLVWARDLSRHGIRVNGVAPGLMDTPMVAGPARRFPRRAAQGRRVSQARGPRRRIRRGGRVPRPHAADQRRGDPARCGHPPAGAHVDRRILRWPMHPIPPRLTAAKLAEAQKAFETALGADKVFFTELDRTELPGQVRGRRQPPPSGRRDRARDGRGSAGGDARRQPVPACRSGRSAAARTWATAARAPLLAGSVVMDLSPDEEDRVRRASSAPSLLEPGRRVLRSLRLHPGATTCRSGCRPPATRGAR